MYIKKRLKNENNIKIEKTIILTFEFKTRSKLLKGRKPPDEIIDIDKFRESKFLKFIILRHKKINIVKMIYSIKILNDCLNDSKLLKEIKFVSDFFKLSSKISIIKIIANKK